MNFVLRSVWALFISAIAFTVTSLAVELESDGSDGSIISNLIHLSREKRGAIGACAKIGESCAKKMCCSAKNGGGPLKCDTKSKKCKDPNLIGGGMGTPHKPIGACEKSGESCAKKMCCPSNNGLLKCDSKSKKCKDPKLIGGGNKKNNIGNCAKLNEECGDDLMCCPGKNIKGPMPCDEESKTCQDPSNSEDDDIVIGKCAKSGEECSEDLMCCPGKGGPMPCDTESNTCKDNIKVKAVGGCAKKDQVCHAHKKCCGELVCDEDTKKCDDAA